MAPVEALAVYNDGTGEALYAAGWFDTIGDVAARHIAKWDGATWTAVGEGLPMLLFALTVYDDGNGEALYAGGWSGAGRGLGQANVAKWDGTSWTILGVQGDGVFALTEYDDGSGPALYAGGNFTSADGISANRVAKWDGTMWSPLGSGLSGREVYALAVYDNGNGPALYSGGRFSTCRWPRICKYRSLLLPHPSEPDTPSRDRNCHRHDDITSNPTQSWQHRPGVCRFLYRLR